ncbi:MAG: type 2 isopentenyl-diphosphate Delta-isomerase [Alicyclobacillaceae bacterium]|nr:type 2 isopentenyl-diphosphate Delta-isomerase [Alicyclobacillaceae bacterium]
MNTTSGREQRKIEHVELASREDAVTPVEDFDDIHLIHNSLPNVRKADVRLDVQLDQLSLKTPLYINAMTGGALGLEDINRGLALAAQATGVAMAVGSQHAALRDRTLQRTYRVVRDVNPDGIVFANVGATVSVQDALFAVEMLEANALQVHLNVPQELVMPEGDRDFRGVLERIAEIVECCPVPVIVKEVGFGMSRQTVFALAASGVRWVDVGGRGGTDFVHIENQRRVATDFDYWRGWGQSTVVSLLEAESLGHKVLLFASGGIRNPLDGLKSLVLGARAIGIAGPILRSFRDGGVPAVEAYLRGFLDGLVTLMTALGVVDVRELCHQPVVVTGRTLEWCTLRGIDAGGLARRQGTGALNAMPFGQDRALAPVQHPQEANTVVPLSKDAG